MSESLGMSGFKGFKSHVAVSLSCSSWSFCKVTSNFDGPEGNNNTKSKVSTPESHLAFEILLLSTEDIEDIASTKITKAKSIINFLFILNKNK